MPPPSTNKRAHAGPSSKSDKKPHGGKPPPQQGGERKRGGFRVGPQNAPKDAYLGKAKKIKESLIRNAKLKQQYAKALKAEGLTSTRLERGAAGGSRGAGGKGKGKGRAGPDEEDMDDEEEDEEDDEPQQPQVVRPPTSLVDQPHSTHTSYRPNVRQPLSVHATRGPPPAAPLNAPTAGGRGGRGGSRTDQQQQQPPRWAPAKDATGKQRQPRMGDKMDAMLAKIRKGL